jgi:hypothetical protein
VSSAELSLAVSASTGANQKSVTCRVVTVVLTLTLTVTVTVTVAVTVTVTVTTSLLQKRINNPAQLQVLIWEIGYQQYATPLAKSKSLKACKLLDGHALRIVDELKKLRALGVVPPKKPFKRPADISSFIDMRKKRQKKEART